MQRRMLLLHIACTIRPTTNGALTSSNSVLTTSPLSLALRYVFGAWSSLLVFRFPIVIRRIHLQDLQEPPAAHPRSAMAFSPSRAFAYNDEANLTFAEISSSEEWIAPHPDLTLSNPTLPMDTLASGWGVDATINPALLTQHYVSSDISAYDAPMQLP